VTILVVLVLCAVWAAYLVPPMLRDRRSGSRSGAGHGLSAIGSAASRILKDAHHPDSAVDTAARNRSGAPSGVSLMPSNAAQARQRRSTVFALLGVLAVISLFAVPVFGLPALALHLGFDVLLGGMGYLTYQRSTIRRGTPVVRSLDFHRQVQHQRGELAGGVQLSENELARRIAN
jgi:hypothetical protein